MQIALHAGVHETDEGRLIKCLSRNAKAFAARGISIPSQTNYRFLLRDAVASIVNGGTPSQQARSVLLDEILGAETQMVEPDRLLLSNVNFFSNMGAALKDGMLYRAAEARLDAFQQLFPQDEIELYIGIRNPATFLPAIQTASKFESAEEMLQGADPHAVRWSDLVTRLREACPTVAITVWCNEDTPLIWGSLLREIAGVEPNIKIVGAFDLLGEIMSPEGMKRFRAYLKEHPVMTEMQKRRVISAFLDKFAKEDEIEDEIDTPGWTDRMLTELTELYEEDLYRLQRIPGVTFFSP
ncbi:MAG TPA: hypothetical protein DEF12_01595 [Rhodobacteraceae bacterium]|jgi:hypothetical protein|nr:hypothetical protein [Paracoccaceae bacterium]